MESLIQKAFDKNSGCGSDDAPGSVEEAIRDQFGIEVRGAKIMIVGAGGAGNNMVSALTKMGIRGAETLAINTDAKQLSVTSAHKKLLIGREMTRGLGAGGYPDIGKKAAEESERELKKLLEGGT